MAFKEKQKAKQSDVRKAGKTGLKSQPTSLATRSKAVGVVRIVGGKFKRSVLPVDDRLGLRPTPERVRETVFDWLTHLTGGFEGLTVLDMFAGSGAMGLEAASRGASEVFSVEKDRKSAARISAVVEKLSAGDTVRLICSDVFVWLNGENRYFDVVFIDPPFDAHLHQRAVEAVLSHLKDNGLLYLENDALLEESWLENLGLESVRRGKAGAVHYLLAKKKTFRINRLQFLGSESFTKRSWFAPFTPELLIR